LLSRDRGSLILDPELGDEGRKREQDQARGVDLDGGGEVLYEYDFGDGWQHELLLEEVLLGDEAFQQTCVAGKRCCPPEDCGGPQGLQSFSKHSRTPITRVTMRPVSGLAILSLNPSLQMKLTDYYAAGNTERTQEPGR
jgi:Plasmid pRiA4b ORF-3-like protein